VNVAPLLYGPASAAKLLGGVSVATIIRMQKRGVLTPVQFNGPAKSGVLPTRPDHGVGGSQQMSGPAMKVNRRPAARPLTTPAAVAVNPARSIP